MIAIACEPALIDECYPVGYRENLRVEFIGSLDDGETLIGTPTVEEIGTATTQITLKQVNSSAVTLDDGVEYAAGFVITARIKIVASKKDFTVIRMSCGTSEGWRTVFHEIKFRTKP